MNEKFTKKDYINEILRLNRVLTQMKYNEEDDKNIKNLLRKTWLIYQSWKKKNAQGELK